MLKTFTTSTLIVISLFFTSPTMAVEWGSLKGRFIVDGKPAELPPLNVDAKDPFCLKTKPTNHSLEVGKDGGLANVIVYLRVPRRGKVDIHPDYEALLKENVVLDNNGCSFKPHVTLVRVGQPLVVKNSDPTGHNTNINIFRFNQTIPAMDETTIKVPNEGPLPQPVVCNIHPFMQGHLLAQAHPYMAASAADGSFEIKNLPAGKHEIQLWHELPGYLKDVATKGGKANRQGRLNVTVAGGQTVDLGDIKVPAAVLKSK